MQQTVKAKVASLLQEKLEAQDASKQAITLAETVPQRILKVSLKVSQRQISSSAV